MEDSLNKAERLLGEVCLALEDGLLTLSDEDIDYLDALVARMPRPLALSKTEERFLREILKRKEEPDGFQEIGDENFEEDPQEAEEG